MASPHPHPPPQCLADRRLCSPLILPCVACGCCSSHVSSCAGAAHSVSSSSWTASHWSLRGGRAERLATSLEGRHAGFKSHQVHKMFPLHSVGCDFSKDAGFTTQHSAALLEHRSMRHTPNNRTSFYRLPAQVNTNGETESAT